MREYELVFVVHPDLDENAFKELVERVKSWMTEAGGQVSKIDLWGKRKLAYRVAKREEGFYVLVQFSSGPDTVREVERRMRVTDMVMKYITVRIDEKLKRVEKRRKMREKRAARKPAPPVAGPGVPTAE